MEILVYFKEGLELKSLTDYWNTVSIREPR